jgi:nicotinamidase-related amidase
MRVCFKTVSPVQQAAWNSDTGSGAKFFMKTARPEAHVTVKKEGRWALLLIDVVNDMAFPGGRTLARAALPVAKHIARLKEVAGKQKVPVVYVNDNFGRWQSDFRHQVEYCQRRGAPGAPIASLLAPGEEDYFVLKPKHSGFYSTTLHPLLLHLGVTKLVLTGFAANLCVMYTANDAYMRDYEIIVPRDCVASERRSDTRQALDHMKRFLKARLTPAARISFARRKPGAD